MSVDNKELYYVKCKGSHDVEEVLEIFRDMGIRWQDGSAADEFLPRRNAGGYCYIYTIISEIDDECVLLYEISPRNQNGRVVMTASNFVEMFENVIVESDISLTDLIML